MRDRFFYAPNFMIPPNKIITFRLPVWLAMLFCLFIADSIAQVHVNLSGFIRDIDTGEMLAQAHVAVTGTGKGTLSDADGRFEIRGLTAGFYDVQIRHIGYEIFTETDVQIREGETTFISIHLLPTPIPLSPVTVSTLPPDMSRGPSVTVLQSNEIIRQGAADAADALKQVPGVTVYEEGGRGGRKTVSIRGCRPDQIAVEVDDIPMNAASGGAVDLSQFPSDQIERIEIIRGGASTLSGSGALGGVIRISTRAPTQNEDSPAFKLTTLGGSYGYGEGRAQMQIPTPGPTFEIYARHNRSKGNFSYEDNGEKKERTNNHSLRSLGQLSATWPFANQWQWQSQFSMDSRERGSPGLISQAPTPEATMKDEPLRVSSQLNWRRFPFRMTLSNYYATQNREYHSPRLQYDSQEDETYYHAPVWTEDINRQWGGFLTGSFANDKRCFLLSQVTAGLHFRRDEYKGTDRLNDGQLSSRSLGYVFRNALSGVGTIQISPKRYFQLTAQGRIDAVEQTELEHETHATGRIHFAITPLKESRWNLIFSGSYGSSYQLPSFVSLFLVESEFAMGNKELKPERGRDGDVGISLRHHPFECSVSAFWNRIEDMIVWRRNFRGQYWPDNLAIGEIKGVEFSGNVSLFEDKLLFRGHATLQQPLNKTPEPHLMNKILPLQPQAQGGASVETCVRNFEGSFGARMMGRRYTTEDNTDPLSTAQRDLKPFTVFDLSLGWNKKLPSAKFAIRGRVSNLLNEHYMIIERSPMPGRNYELQLSIEK